MKNLITERDGGVAQGEGPEFKPQYQKKESNYATLLSPRIAVLGLREMKTYIRTRTCPQCSRQPTQSRVSLSGERVAKPRYVHTMG
jgi:hypothetical protein